MFSCCEMEYAASCEQSREPALGQNTLRCRRQIQQGVLCAAVDKIEERRKPEDFIGHRKPAAKPRMPRVRVSPLGPHKENCPLWVVLFVFSCCEIEDAVSCEQSRDRLPVSASPTGAIPNTLSPSPMAAKTTIWETSLLYRLSHKPFRNCGCNSGFFCRWMLFRYRWDSFATFLIRDVLYCSHRR